MATKIARIGVEREAGFLYFLDKMGDVSRVPMARGGRSKKGASSKVAKAGVEREAGWLYFIDRDGDVARTKMARRGRASGS
ncbi:MAG: hypothetical protein J4G09_04240 [Proteobacteria bacterium]|nr:hypothetical protein [Pseudomonadota bacterium]